MAKQLQQNQLSKQQRMALNRALWGGEASVSRDTVFAACLKQVLLRAFILHKHRDRLPPNTLNQYRRDLKRRLKQCLDTHSDNKPGWRLKRHYPQVPYYLFLLLDEASSLPPSSTNAPTPATKKLSASPQSPIPSSRHLPFRINLARQYLSYCVNDPRMIKFKRMLGCISLIWIEIGNEPVRIRGKWVHYHDLYHLEVGQLERILMGRDWVSGIHGINSRLFHESPIIEEYDSFLDEARIAIHEALTRPTAFSQLKALCWMTLLLLQGINPLAVLLRHRRSMKKKQQELWVD